MAVKIFHAADLHMDSPFDALSEKQAVTRRREQRELLDKLAELIERENAQVVLLAGDILDSQSSYYETQEALVRAFSKINAKIFIAPGNHDYYCAQSPYSADIFPDNVHIFKSNRFECVQLDDIGCRVWGAGFTAPHSDMLLNGFAIDKSDYINIGIVHGDMAGDSYNRILPEAIAASGLDYLALGHVHTFSGIQKLSNTYYAYPGCPEGRGFDETGEKGVIVGTVSKDGCDLRFQQVAGRQYKIINIDMTDKEDVVSAVEREIGRGCEQDIVRIILAGESDCEVNLEKIEDTFSKSVFSLQIKNRVTPKRDLWAGAGEATLKGIFLNSMLKKYEAADGEEKEKLLLAVGYGLAALENREGRRV